MGRSCSNSSALLLLLLLLLPALVWRTHAQDTANVVTLQSFTWVKFYTDGNNSTAGILRVCIAEDNPEFPNKVDPVVLVYSTSSATEYNVEGNASNTLQCADFVVDVATLDYNNKQTYYMRNGDSVGYATFLFRFSPNDNVAENLTWAGVIRVTGQQVSDIQNCTPFSSKVCYLSDNLSAVDLCSAVPVDEGGFILICEGSVELLTVENRTVVATMESRYDENVITVSVEGVDPSNLELFLQTNEEGSLTPCLWRGSCPMPMTGGGSNITIGIVEIGADNQALASIREVVVDYGVKTNSLSHDTIEVTWEPWSKTSFEVSIQPVPYDNGFSFQIVSCSDDDPEACHAFFIKLEQDRWSEYLVNVTSAEGEHVVSTILKLDTSNNVDEASATLTNITIYTDDDFQTTNAEICFQLQKENITSVRLVVIDVVGNTIEDAINTSGHIPLCSPSHNLNELEDDQLRMMVFFEDQYLAMYSTQVDLYIFKPEIFPLDNSTARASWRKLNSGRYYASHYPGSVGGSDVISIECSLTRPCNYYITENETSSEMFSISEVAKSVTQFVTVNKKLIDANYLSISTPFYKRFDNHLVVCFEPPTEELPTRYELGIQCLGELVSSDQDAEIVEDYGGQTCVVSSASLSLGAYVNLWAVVAAYNSTGNIIQAEEAFYQHLYLSSNRYVLVVVEASVTPGKFSFKVSWKLVDSLDYLRKWHVFITDENGKTIAQTNRTVTEGSAFLFPDIDTGVYTVCVSVSINDSSYISEDTCSDVIDLQLTGDVDVTIEMDQLYTNTGQLKITWNVPLEAEETVSTIMIDWSTNNKDKAHIFQQSVELLSKASKAAANFLIVPTTQSSVTLPVASGTWDICVSPVVGNQAGQSTCLDQRSVGEAEVVTSPEQVQFDGQILSWVPPNVDENIDQYYVEFTQAGMMRHIKTSDTRVEVQTIVDPGEWTVTVQSVNGNGYTSDPQEAILEIVLNGIYISYEQSGFRQITLSWQDIVTSAGGNNQQQHWYYIITVAGVMMDTIVKCGQLLTVCSTILSGIQANASQPVTVTVSRLNSTQFPQNTESVYVVDVKEVTELRWSVSSKNQLGITWFCIPGVHFYNVSLYDVNRTLIYHDKQTLPCSYSFSDPSLTNIIEGVARVQACYSGSRYRCGPPNETAFNIGNGDSNGNNTLVIILSTLGGCLALLVLIAGLLFYRRSKKIALKNKDNKNGGSINTKEDHPYLTRSQSNERGGIANDAYQEQFNSNTGSDAPPPRAVTTVIPRSSTPPNLVPIQIAPNNRRSGYLAASSRPQPLDQPNMPNGRVFRPPRLLQKSPERPAVRHATTSSTGQISHWRQQSEARMQRQRSVSPTLRVGPRSMRVPLTSTIPRLIVPNTALRTSRKEEHELHKRDSGKQNHDFDQKRRARLQ